LGQCLFFEEFVEQDNKNTSTDFLQIVFFLILKRARKISKTKNACNI